MSHGRTSELTKAYRAVAALAVLVVVVAVATVGVRASYGIFSDDYYVSGTFPRASQALHKGSDVKYLGVSVGKVRSITADSLRVRIKLALHHGTKIPKSVKAVIEPNTFFGDKFVDLVPTSDTAAPWLANGDRLAHTSSGYEVEQLIATGDQLVKGINARDLQTLITELTKFSQGEGDKVARNIKVGVKAAAVFNDTLQAQLTALDSLQRFQTAIRDIGPDVSKISGDLDTALPVFNQARTAYERALATLRPFADTLASFISVNRPDFDRILSHGENIVRVVLAQRQDISDTIYGLSRYFYKFATAGSQDTLPDGTKFAYFKVFVDNSDLTKMLCNVIGPPNPQLGAVQGQLLNALKSLTGGALDCTSQYEAGQTTPASPTASSSSPSTSSQAAPSTSSANGPSSAADDVYGQLGQPDQTKPATLGSVLQQLLGGSG